MKNVDLRQNLNTKQVSVTLLLISSLNETLLTLVDLTTDEITSLIFLQPYPVLVSADNKGKLMFWTVKPAPNKYQQVSDCDVRLCNLLAHHLCKFGT